MKAKTFLNQYRHLPASLQPRRFSVRACSRRCRKARMRRMRQACLRTIVKYGSRGWGVRQVGFKNYVVHTGGGLGLLVFWSLRCTKRSRSTLTRTTSTQNTRNTTKNAPKDAPKVDFDPILVPKWSILDAQVEAKTDLNTKTLQPPKYCKTQ